MIGLILVAKVNEMLRSITGVPVGEGESGGTNAPGHDACGSGRVHHLVTAVAKSPDPF